MGAWSTSLYGSDLACDVKDEYIALLLDGYTPDTAASMTWDNLQLDEEDADLYWLILADTQWKYGHLNEKTLEKALEVLNSGRDEDGWSGADLRTRRKVLEKLKVQLSSPQPPAKNPRPKRRKKCKFKVGDVLSFHLTEESMDREGWPWLTSYFGKYGVAAVVGYVEEPQDCSRHPAMEQCSVLLIYQWISASPPDVSVVDTCPIIDLRPIKLDGSAFPGVTVSSLGEKSLEPTVIGHRMIEVQEKFPRHSDTWWNLAHYFAKAIYLQNPRNEENISSKQGDVFLSNPPIK